jgi:hypothetical protein
MKMTAADFNTIKPALLATKRAGGFLPGNLLSTREMWDVFHRAWGNGSIDGNRLYSLYNDAHIETAMKQIFK